MTDNRETTDDEERPRTRLQRILLTVSCVGFFVMIPINASMMGISEVFWINLAYLFAIYAYAVIFGIGLLIVFARTLNLGHGATIAMAIGLFVAVVISEQFIRDGVKAVLAP